MVRAVRDPPELAKRAAALSAAPSQCAAGRPRRVSHRRAESARRHAAAASLGSPGPRAGSRRGVSGGEQSPAEAPASAVSAASSHHAASARRAANARRAAATAAREPFPTRRERATRSPPTPRGRPRGVFRSRSNAGTIRSGSGPTTPRTRARLSRRKDARAAARRRRRLARRVARRSVRVGVGHSKPAHFIWIFDRLTMWSSRRGASRRPSRTRDHISRARRFLEPA